MLSWSKFQKALEWLENLPPPFILAPPARKAPSYRQYGPRNDLDELAKRGELTAPEISKHLTTIHAIPPRTGITEWIVEGELNYLWDISGDEPEEAKIICELTDDLFVLGRGIDHVVGWGRILTGEEVKKMIGVKWIPDIRGDTTLRVAYPGFLDHLLKTFPRISIEYQKKQKVVKKEERAEPRPMGYRALTVALHHFSCFRLDSSFRWEDTMLVAAWMRHAVSQRLKELGKSEEWINSYVLGHGVKNHMSFVPLPSIGHPHSDGRIRRAMIVYRGEEAIEDEDLGEIWLRDLTGKIRGTLRVIKVEEAKRDKTFSHYLGTSTTWLTVTPVILHGHDHRHGKFSPLKAQKLVLQALSESGLPSFLIEEVWFQKSPFWRGAGHAKDIQVPQHLLDWPRYHVGMTFRSPLTGPLLAGLGQHYGIGLFARSPS